MDCGNSGFCKLCRNFGKETWDLIATIREIYYKGTIVLVKYTTKALVYYKVAVAIADV